jgi:hypothetical protein
VTDLGVPPPPTDQPAPTGEQPSSDIPLWLVLGLVLVMVVAAGVTAVVLLTQKNDDDPSRSYPSQWDARIAPYVKIVEKQRGLTFMHPVRVRFLPNADFEKTVTADKSKLDKEERQEIEQYTGLFRALGLLAGDVDLFEAINDVHGSGTLAYYSPEDEEIVIRGGKVTASGRAIVVHELTHVLQDQHFAIGDRLEKLRKANEKASSTEYDVFDAIVEGDAERIATRYRESLPEKQRRALARSEEKQREDVSAAYKTVPKVVLTMVSSPYTLGESMVQTAAANGGNAAVDDLFRDPPAHDSVLLDPLPGLAGTDKPAKVEVPDLRDGEDEFVSGEYGALSLYFMLAERTPVLNALSAADAWDGDAFVGFERDGTTCARAAVRGENEQATATLLSALRRWAAAAPGKTAEVGRDGALVTFESCDPGTSAGGGRDASIQALQLVSIRSQLGAVFVKQGASADAARCTADRAVHEFPMSTLTAATISAADTDRLRQIVAACR